MRENYGKTVKMKGENDMREKRMLQNEWLRGIAIQLGLHEGSTVIVRERSMLKDGSYITRQIRRGKVLKLYPYHFYCQMKDGTKESFRYNEFLGYEARLIRLKEKKTDKVQSIERYPFAA